MTRVCKAIFILINVMLNPTVHVILPNFENSPLFCYVEYKNNSVGSFVHIQELSVQTRLFVVLPRIKREKFALLNT